MSNRKYEQSLRAEAAEDTRRRILGALRSQLSAEPSRPVRVEHVARLARVARPTVYTVFGSRAGLFDALGAELLHRGGFDQLTEAAADPDARRGLRNGIEGVCALYAGDRDVFRALYSMAQLDAEAVAGAVQRLEDQRVACMNDVAQNLEAQGLLREGVTVDRAADALWMLTSFDAFDLLYTGRSLSASDAAAAISLAANGICYLQASPLR
ncbi:TetR/AcrR family transcriptional regulator [Nocardia sp. A7]|uniref:TetR/AcrR family transcriptional regulator n=1 Tax=Nocardia sp. A7 TaxID=2789274 RepID=UPI00397C159E